MESVETVLPEPRILVVDRDPVFRRFVRDQFGAGAHGLPPIADAERLPQLEARSGDIVVLGIEGAGEACLEAIRQAADFGPVVVASATGSLAFAVAAMRAGAADFLVKPVGADALAAAIRRAVETGSRSKAVTRAADPAPFGPFVGVSEAMRGVFETISRIAPSRAPVFVTGESGTGKELTAEAIHARSGRAGAFVAINCAAIPRELMESEIFGHARGAFTGAHDDRPGAAELADGGTLFLDEICEMAPDLQTKLLRFIQTGTVRRIGASAQKPVDVRFVCATNRNPEAEVAERRFRADLFFRLHVLPVHLPPLRERAEDILPLAESFLSDFSAEEQRRFSGFDDGTAALLRSYDWPGNVRQLQNVVRRAVVMNDGERIGPEMLAMALAHAGQPPATGPIARPHSISGPGDRAVTAFRPDRAAIEPFCVQERRIIEQALAAFHGNVGQAAAALHISASTIYRKKQAWQDGRSAA